MRIISSAHDEMKLIFAVLYVSLNDGPFTRCYKTAVFYILLVYYTVSMVRWRCTCVAMPYPHTAMVRRQVVLGDCMKTISHLDIVRLIGRAILY